MIESGRYGVDLQTHYWIAGLPRNAAPTDVAEVVKYSLFTKFDLPILQKGLH
jgi:hypothetical protein